MLNIAQVNFVKPTTTPKTPRKKYQAPQRPSFEELKKKYELPTATELPPTKSSNTSIEELKKKYETSAVETTPQTTRTPRSPKMLKKSKVKQMASMFNSKITQIIKRDTKYSTLVNELSPVAKMEPKATLPKPLITTSKIRYTKDKAPLPSPRTKSKARAQQKSMYFVAEDDFAKLTVKDKAQLYTQFIEAMSKKNPKFVKHAELIEANVKKEVARGEVINEKQESVKYLRDELEARCAFPKQTISPLAIKRNPRVKRIAKRFKTIAVTTIKSKEFEDIPQQNVSHISTLTVTLKPLKPEAKRQRRSRSLPRSISLNLVNIEPCHKRNNDEMRSCLPIEVYAPPKKIRRTRAEHLSPNVFFQNQQLEQLFFTWLKERHEEKIEEKIESIAQIDDVKDKQKSSIDKLLEEAIAKLETVETKQKEQLIKDEKEIDTKLVIAAPPIAKLISHKNKPAPAIPQLNKKPTASSESSTTSSAKHSEAEESESGLSTLPKITSEDSQPESQNNQVETLEPEFEFIQPLKPIRKKKMRRTLTWKKDLALVETNTVTSTDSECDIKYLESKTKNKNKKLVIQTNTEELIADAQVITESPAEESPVQSPTEPSFTELDMSLMREVNSPRKIKSAYTLTMFSPPPPYTNNDDEEDISELNNTSYANREASRSWPSLVDDQLEQDLTMEVKAQSSELSKTLKKATIEPRSLADSFIDQGFETGSNEMDSPIRPPRRAVLKRQDKVNSPLFIKLASESRRVSIDLNCKIPENPSGFSTPIKGHLQQEQHHVSSPAQQQLFSPINTTSTSATIPLKNRRKSLYDPESRRNSLVMQVIREDHPLEHHEMVSPRPVNTTEQVFFANAPTLDMSTDMSGLNPSKTSQFWIKCGDFSVSLDIYYNDNDKIRLLYEIFSQRSCETKDLHFGIDDHKFSVHNPQDQENISKRLPDNKDCSHYWFSTGDLAIPFNGKLLSSRKIQRLFEFIKSSVEETGILRFGVDEVEFSNVPEFWNQSPKFSMESNYSMLVGLQSGTSNGLEGRSKYAWPHSKPIRVSDLDQSDGGEEDFEDNESGRLSFSPFGSNNFDLASLDADELSMPRNSEAMMSPESFCFQDANVPIDQLFDPKYTQKHNIESTDIDDGPALETTSILELTITTEKQEHLHSKTSSILKSEPVPIEQLFDDNLESPNIDNIPTLETSAILKSTPVPEMLSTLQTQQERLSLVQEKISSYTESANLCSSDLDSLKGTPEYLIKLKAIVSDISAIGSKTNFKTCSTSELEKYMFFLSRYADICLNSCSDHMEKVLDALLDQRAVLV